MEMKPHEKSLGRNPLSDAPYRNPGMVLNGEGPGRHPLGDAPYLDLDTVLNEQGNEVGIVLNKSLKDEVVNIKRQGDRIILVKLLVRDLIFNVISAYASQIGLNESIKRRF
jgi:hypothetical protein